MPAFDDRAHSSAAPEEVWKLLYDPTRFTEWWVGVETVEPGTDGYTMYPAGYPDFPMPQALRTDHVGHRVVISCLVSDLRFEWRLTPGPDGASTDIDVHVEIPAAESARLAVQQETIHRSLGNLATLAAAP